MEKIADIAPVSYRAYRFLKRELTAAYTVLQRKREERRNRKYMKLWAAEAKATEADAAEANATEAKATEANATDAPQPAADEDSNSIQVKVVKHSEFAKCYVTGINSADQVDIEHSSKAIVLDTKKPDMKKLGKLSEALHSHPPFPIRRPIMSAWMRRMARSGHGAAA